MAYQMILEVVIKELKQRRRRRRGRRLVKKIFFYFTSKIRECLNHVQYANGSKNVLRLNMQRQRTVPNGNAKNKPSSSTFCRRHRTWSFLVVLRRTAKKCTTSYNARAQPLFCSLNLLFCDVLSHKTLVWFYYILSNL